MKSSRFYPIALLACALPFSSFAQAPAAVPAPMPAPVPLTTEKLGTTIFDWEKLEVKRTPVGYLRNVADQPTATLEEFECHITTLLPGLASHPPHRHPQEEIIIVKEGLVEVMLNGKPHRAGPGSTFFYACLDLHGLTNVGDKPATYFVVNFHTKITRNPPTTPTIEAAPAGKLGSSVFEWEKLKVTPTKTGERRDIVDSPTVTMSTFESHATTLNVGEGVPAHHHGEEQLLLLREGALDVTIKGATHRVGAGSIVFFASNGEWSIKSVGDRPALYHMLKVVTPETPKATE